MNLVRFLVVTCVSAVMLAACSNAGLDPFSSDGCSLFPDQSLINSDDWCSCCFQHDLAYWRGGTAFEREASDLQLKECVYAKTGDQLLAELMHNGVRFGGSPYFYNWYRWGYGWDYDRKYKALTPEENAIADQLLQDYFSAQPTSVCHP